MGRTLGSALILLLFALDVALPYTPLGRRGSEAAVRSDVAGAFGAVGERLPDFELPDLDGSYLRLSDLRGYRVVLTFERSLDW
jgi:hypothetical protein